MKPTKIYTLGDYYKTEGLRNLCHDIKNGYNSELIATFLIKSFIDEIPEDSVLIGVPFGFGNLTMRIISECAPVLKNVFCKTRFTSVYSRKYRGEIVTPDTVGLELYPAFNRKDLEEYGHIILVDNVIDTGATIARCIDLLGRPCEAMCIAVNWENYNKNNW